jgi:GT2 family glycosyltransferase
MVHPLNNLHPSKIIMNKSLKEHHLLYGYFPFWQAFKVTEQILRQNQPEIRAHAFFILAQSLLFNPYDHSLLKTVSSLQNLPGISHGYKKLLHKLHQEISRYPSFPTEQVFELINVTRNWPESIYKLYQEHNHPHLRWHILFSLWENGQTDILTELATSFNKHYPFFSIFTAWINYHLNNDITQIVTEEKNCLYFNLLGEFAFQKHDTERAISCWLRSLMFDPCQPHLVYRIYDALQTRPKIHDIDQHKIHIVFYTYNKLQTTINTLKSLLASHIGNARITLLNNGSTDFSPQTLTSEVQKIDTFKKVNLIHLPTNIGAPAARNWLWQLPESQEADYVVFLDDDIQLPSHWLEFFLQNFTIFPEAVVVGGKALDPCPLKNIQYIFRYFQEIGNHKIRFTSHNPTIINLGQYNYRRPCLSVMGCCHIFNVARWKQKNIPLFDVRFSPSQVDDLEHDLQIWLNNGHVIYDGRVNIIHLQNAGKSATMSRARWAHVWGNHMKMEGKFNLHELKLINNRVIQADYLHWQHALTGIKDILPPEVYNLLKCY